MIIVGLTGSIASGKSEVANIFRKLGFRVFDADAEVHKAYKDGSAAGVLAHFVPEATSGKAVDRGILSRLIAKDANLLSKIESLVHPLIRKRREDFLATAQAEGERLVVLDVPLLFETGQNADVDMTVVVTAPQALREERALARPGMTREKLALIEARQWPQLRKIEHADHVINNDQTLSHLADQTAEVITKILSSGPTESPHA